LTPDQTCARCAALVESAALRCPPIPTASIICTGEYAIDCYLAFGLAEAKALVEQNRAAVLAIAEMLMIRRTLDDAQEIDTIIATAPALARRADWARVIENAATFTAGLEG